jgi:hypothetical protein
VARTVKNFLFDRGAVLATNTHFWKAASKFGFCLLPQLVVDEIKRTAEDASVNATQNSSAENAAVEFMRFLPQSNWQVTDRIKTHPELTTADNQLSRNARMSFLMGQYAYGVADHEGDRLTILVTDDQTLIRKINELNVDRLCATTAIAVKQWVFAGEIPIVIERAEGTFNLGQKISKYGNRDGYSRRSRRGLRSLLLNILGISAIAVFLLLASLLVWQQAQPKQFNQFWQKTGLPAFPLAKPRP